MTQLDPRLQQARAYLRHQAQKGLADLRREVERTAADLAQALADWSEEQAQRKPSPDEWSVVEVLRHLATAMERSLDFIPRLAQGQESEAGSPGPPTYEGLSLGELKDLVQKLWTKALAMIDGLPTNLNLEATRNHFVFGPLNCKEWIAFLRLHGADHIGQIGQIRAKLG